MNIWSITPSKSLAPWDRKDEVGAVGAKNHVIWSNNNLDLDDWRDVLSEEFLGKSEEELYSLMYEVNDMQLDDERVNLNIQMPSPILMIADIGRWNGRFPGYQEIKSGNIRDCLHTSMDYATFYVDKLGDLRCDAVHHDGTNYYLYRVYKRGVTEAQIERLQEKILNGTATRRDITRVTSRLGDAIGKVYGWSFPREVKEYER